MIWFLLIGMVLVIGFIFGVLFEILLGKRDYKVYDKTTRCS